MAEEPLFRGVIDFLVKLGIYDVILPFLLVFSVVFAILDKTKVFGTDTIEGEEYSKKNINAMIAFVIAFLVIVSKQLVATINKALANVVILLLMIVMFMVLIGVFFKKDDEVILEGGWKIGFMVVILIAIILIFLNAIPTADGTSDWLAAGWGWLVDNWDSNAIGAIVMFIVIIGLILGITGDKKSSSQET